MEQTYAVGSVVWVKITGGKWWPGEVVSSESCPEDVTKGLKKDPLFIVKFFEEDYYELVKNGSHIQPFLCSRAAEFVKKGRELLKYDPHLEKFDKDVAEAEQLCGNISDYVMDLPSADSDLDISVVSNHIGSSFSEDKHNHGSALVSSSVVQPKNGTDDLLPSFGGDVDVRIRTQLTPASSVRSMNYLCDVCGFQTSRIANIILHHKSHSDLYRHWSGKGSPDLKDRSVFSDGRLPRPKDNSKAVQRCKRKLAINDEKAPRKKKVKKQSDVGSVVIGDADSSFDAISKIKSGKSEESKRQKKKKENDSDAVFEKIKRQAMKKMNRKRGGGGTSSFMGTSSLTGISAMKGLKRDGVSDESSDDEEFLIMREDFGSKEDDDEVVEDDEEGKVTEEEDKIVQDEIKVVEEVEMIVEEEGILDVVEKKATESERKESMEEKSIDVDLLDERILNEARLLTEGKPVSNLGDDGSLQTAHGSETIYIEQNVDKRDIVDAEENVAVPPPVDYENVKLGVNVGSVECKVDGIADDSNDSSKKLTDKVIDGVENIVNNESEKDTENIETNKEESSKAGEISTSDPSSCPITDVTEKQLTNLLPPSVDPVVVVSNDGQVPTGSDHSYDAKPSTSNTDDVDVCQSSIDIVESIANTVVEEKIGSDITANVSHPQLESAVENCAVEQQQQQVEQEQDPELPPLPPPLPPSPPPPPPPPPPCVDYMTLAEDVIIDPGDIPLPPPETEAPVRQVIEETVPVLEYTKLETLIQPPDMGTVYLETGMEAPLVEGDEIIHLGNEQVIDSSMDVFCNEIVIESDDKYVAEDYDNICLLAEAERAKTENNSGVEILVSGTAAGDEQGGKGKMGGGLLFSSAEDAINGSSRLLGSGDGQTKTLARKQMGLSSQAR